MIVTKMAVVVVHHMAMSSVTLHCVAINSISQDVVDAVTVSMRSNAIVIVDMNIWLSYVIHYNIVGGTMTDNGMSMGEIVRVRIGDGESVIYIFGGSRMRRVMGLKVVLLMRVVFRSMIVVDSMIVGLVVDMLVVLLDVFMMIVDV